MSAATALRCEMRETCERPVTHIGEKGYAYCAECAVYRREGHYERTRKLRPWELALLVAGKQIPSYRPARKPATTTTDAEGEQA